MAILRRYYWPRMHIYNKKIFWLTRMARGRAFGSVGMVEIQKVSAAETQGGFFVGPRTAAV